jgi:redox-sensitive bicupin YhaK (pirin superfamily)
VGNATRGVACRRRILSWSLEDHLEQPVKWYGPIGMNTQEQPRQAFTQLQEGTFLKENRSE